jgi:hypothetical protein
VAVPFIRTERERSSRGIIMDCASGMEVRRKLKGDSAWGGGGGGVLACCHGSCLGDWGAAGDMQQTNRVLSLVGDLVGDLVELGGGGGLRYCPGGRKFSDQCMHSKQIRIEQPHLDGAP